MKRKAATPNRGFKVADQIQRDVAELIRDVRCAVGRFELASVAERQVVLGERLLDRGGSGDNDERGVGNLRQRGHGLLVRHPLDAQEALQKSVPPHPRMPDAGPFARGRGPALNVVINFAVAASSVEVKTPRTM